MIVLDHLAVSGQTLTEATTWVEDKLGVSLQTGGEHEVFHTHNTLLGLEDGLYLEAIAINPRAPQPDRPRWFDLDSFVGTPRLSNWIMRCGDIDQFLSRCDVDFGKPVALQRGQLKWQMAVPDTGRLPFDNTAPAIIQWQTTKHPASGLKPSGVILKRLTISHPQANALNKRIAPFFRDDRIKFETGQVGISAEFGTPHGDRFF
ncbi:MAG: VOC family protein [Paracoccaceae bacterium]